MMDLGWRSNQQAEQMIYDHLLFCVKNEPAQQVLERFKALFVDGIMYNDHKIWKAIEQLAFAKQAEKQFPLMFNRCCHIIINHWQLQHQNRLMICPLIDAIDRPQGTGLVHAKIARRIRQLLQTYIHSAEYLQLKRLKNVINSESSTKPEEQPIANLINRYPYLYDHTLLSEDSSREQLETIKKLKEQTQQKFEINLSHYLTYQIRQYQANHNPQNTGRIIQPVANPTLLSDRELGQSFKHFINKVEGDCTYKDLSSRFITQIQHTPKFSKFKQSFYEYLIAGIDPKYGTRNFNDRLYKHIFNYLPDYNNSYLSELLMIRSCTHTLNYLVTEVNPRPSHMVFMDLITNLGPAVSTGLLLKIVLICQKTKPLLESRLSLIFNHYESFTKKSVPWLIKGLENWNIAGSIYFGKLDTSYLKFLLERT